MPYTVTPSRAVIDWRSASLTSGSRCESSRPRSLMSVTRTPSAAKMQAYSQPITPPPTTIIDVGMRWIVSSESLSTMTSPSSAKPLGGSGRAPVATRKTSAVRRRGSVP